MIAIATGRRATLPQSLLRDDLVVVAVLQESTPDSLLFPLFVNAESAQFRSVGLRRLKMNPADDFVSHSGDVHSFLSNPLQYVRFRR